MPWNQVASLQGPQGPQGDPGVGAGTDYPRATDLAVTTTTAADAITIPVTQAGTYLFRAFLLVGAAATTTGIRPGVRVAGTASTRQAYKTEAPASGTAATVSFNATGAATASPSGTQYVTVEGLATWAATPSGGTALVITLASEVAGSAVTMYAGSFANVRKVA